MSIYRAYDIRGVYNQDLTCEVAENIGKAYATYINGGEVVVGFDARESATSLRDSLVKGLTLGGCDVVDVGMVPTPVLYFTISHYKKDGGIMITGSHNPPEYNGFKLCRGTHTLYGKEIQELRRIIDSGEYRVGEGRVKKLDVKEIYLSYVAERISLDKKISVVVDGGNGAVDDVAEKLFSRLDCEVSCIYCQPDGSFPNHFPDPTVDENLKDLIGRVRENKADLGVAFDGDCDRLGVVDGSGNIVRGDQILVLFARQVLERKPGSRIIFEVKCSQALIDEIKKEGGVPVMYRTGHSFIKKKMREEGSPLAGEMSGHFFFADNYYGFDDGIYAAARLMEILSKSGKTLAELVEGMPHYHSTPEIRLKCDEKEKFGIVEEMREKFREEYDVIDIDGVRVEFGDGWGLVRASNTEPAIILRFEAETNARLKEIKGIIVKELVKFPSLADITII
ncbi:MAG: phosphomannomutase/phosphoglucomutase [Candidatus Altiarchaeota archaeon]|nr:phosphomannomutase/phosphoglucomutase [Candidatus Altiarchaeota archaeon]